MQAGVTVGSGTSAVWVGGATVGGGGVEVCVAVAVGFPQEEATTARVRNINILFIMFARPHKQVCYTRV